MRRRLGILLIVIGGVAGLLIATGVVRLRVRIEPSDWVSASPFWREEPAPATLPQPLGIWVELARVVRPAVVNVSTLQRAPRPGPEDFFRRFFRVPEQGGRGRQSLGSGFMVSADGYIRTNFPVVGGAS